ncbi:hypothetical protein ABEB36_005970 [Hypothenemus hampei]|uniref:Uncharacterized protein n=1 Tax=Hypothenemus hampei TaxID=57062 RepID=A0ABD1F2Q2_HYPHA
MLLSLITVNVTWALPAQPFNNEAGLFNSTNKPATKNNNNAFNNPFNVSSILITMSKPCQDSNQRPTYNGDCVTPD